MFSKNLIKATFRSSSLLKPFYKQLSPIVAYPFAKQTLADKLQKTKAKTPLIKVTDGTAGHEVTTNEGLKQFILRVYKTTGLSVYGALATSYYVINSGLLFSNQGLVILGGALGGLGGAIGCSLLSPKKHIEEVKNGHSILRTENSIFRLLCYSSLVGGLGMLSSPLFFQAQMMNPAILPLSIGITTSIFGGCSLYAYTRKANSLLSWGSSLYGCLWGLIGMQVAGLIANVFYPNNMFSAAMFNANTFLGVGVFSAFVAYDTHVAIQSYQSGNADHLNTSLELFLDFWSILMRVTRILMMFTSKSDD